jgi:putative transcriptional regulator
MLLIATPLVSLPPFRRAVVFIGEHDRTGALGLILTLPTVLRVDEVLPDLGPLASEPPVVHIGGPVQSDTAIVVAKAHSARFARETALPHVGIIDPTNPPDSVTELRVFAGFSGWDEGQLEDEIAEGSWWSVAASADDLFTADAAGLWGEATRRLRGGSAFYATYPDDPTQN